MFNLRSYGIVIQHDKVLLSREFIHGREILKFPGGGLQFGEGLADCVKREFKEEYDLNVEVDSCFYVTDFFVPSAFDKTQQVISVYFLVNVNHEQQIPLQRINNSGDGPAHWHQLTWISRMDITEDVFHFPIDKKVGDLLRKMPIQ